MLTEIYIEALLVDEDLADLVWEFRIVASGSFHLRFQPVIATPKL